MTARRPLVLDGGAMKELPAADDLAGGFAAIEWGVSTPGAALTTGLKGLDVGPMPWAGEIVEATLLIDQTGSIEIGIWKDSYANFPPVFAGDSIVASAPPAISSGVKAQDSTLTGWTVAFAAGDIFRFNINSVATATWVKLNLKVRKL